MRDAVYSASSVDEALQLASRSLGVTLGQLRYVVLDPGSEQQPAQIAVLLDAMRTNQAGRAAPEPAIEDPLEAVPRVERMRRWFRVLSEALGQPLDAEIVDSGDAGVRLRVSGDASLLENDEWDALELLLQRAFGPPRLPGRVSLEIPGRRGGSREARLRERAQELASAVRRDGESRRTEPLNSYERRLVHVVVAELGGLVTESEGEGAERCVSIRLAEASAGT